MFTTNIALWCFSFVTLFNLQGTRPVRLSGGTYSILPRRSAFVKHFFQLFSKFFRRLPRPSAVLSDSSFILPEPLEFVKHFFNFFRSFFALDFSFSAVSRTAHVLYQNFQDLSSAFFTSLKTFLLSPLARPPRFRQLAYYTRPLPLCQHLSAKFCHIFSGSAKDILPLP